MVQFLVADDHPLMREAIRMVAVDLYPDIQITETETFPQTIDALTSRAVEYDLILLDLCMPEAGGMQGLMQIGELAAETPLVVISHLDDPDTIRQVMACGAAGFIPKSHGKPLISSAIRLILSGGIYLPPDMMRERLDDRPSATQPPPRRVDPDSPEDDDRGPLTRRQRRVFELMAEGCSNKQIARHLEISEWTVKAHVSAVLRKLGVNTRVEAVVAARRMAQLSESSTPAR